MKGFGFFVGGLLLEVAGFRGALWLMAALLAFVLVCVAVACRARSAKPKPPSRFASSSPRPAASI